MSVYKPAKSRFWQFDFVQNGRRFHGSTGQVARRNAEAVERQKRLEAGTGKLGATSQMSLDNAAGRYWAEVGIGRGDAEDVERRIEALVGIIGPKTLLGDIGQAEVATAIQKRRGVARVRSKKEGAKTYLPANATVNRDIIETLRPILRRARSHWTPTGASHGLPEIDWTALRLREPRALSRMYGADEKLRWIDATQDNLRLFLEMLLTYGPRFGEMFFRPEKLAFDPVEGCTLTLQKGRKQDVLLVIPIRGDHGKALAARFSRAVAAGLDHLWFYEGEDGPICYSPGQVEYRIDKAATAAGVVAGRRIHGARHHAGSTILKRSGGSMKAVQSLLGHATISSSQRYAHVLVDDMRSFLEDEVSRNSPEPAAADDAETKAG